MTHGNTLLLVPYEHRQFPSLRDFYREELFLQAVKIVAGRNHRWPQGTITWPRQHCSIHSNADHKDETIDHTNLPAHKSRYIENFDPPCSIRQVICDVQHMLKDCPVYQHYRQLLVDKLKFITSSSYQNLTVQCISINTILCFDSRINPTQRKIIFDSLSTFLKNSKANA